MTGLTKKILIFVVVMAAVAAFGWFGRKAWKHYTEKNLIAQANADISQNNLRGADLCLRRVLQINPMSVQGARMVADLLDSEGAPQSVIWRVRVAKLEPDNITNTYALIETALRRQNLPAAAKALAGIPDKYKNTVVYHKLSGAVAWSGGRIAEAEEQCNLALQLDPTNRAIMLNLATIELAMTNRAVNQAGRVKLNELSSDPELGMVALHHLQADAVARKAFPEALGYSERINMNRAATFSDKVEYLQLLRTTKSAGADSCLADLKKTAMYEPHNAYTLAHWMTMAESPRTAYQWLNTLPTVTQTNLTIQLIKSDCLIGMKDWNGLLAFLKNQDWGQKEFYRAALTSLAQRSLGDDVDSQASWQRALHLAADQQENLLLLSRVTGIWGWKTEEIATLQEAMVKFSDPKWASDQLTVLLYSQGNTKALVDLMTTLQSASPEDPRLKNNLADVLLLTKSELERAYRLANEAYLTDTNNQYYISTYAYALLMQNKPDMAHKVISNLKPESLKIPSIAAYYGVIEVQTGHKDMAREPLAHAAKANLLPEEKAIVTYALAQL